MQYKIVTYIQLINPLKNGSVLTFVKHSKKLTLKLQVRASSYISNKSTNQMQQFLKFIT
jgi:hypothetical protein